MPDSNNELREIIGTIPNWIFDYLELSDSIKKEWKLGSKASDFGGHNQFVQKYSERIENLIKQREQSAVEKYAEGLKTKVRLFQTTGVSFEYIPLEALDNKQKEV